MEKVVLDLSLENFEVRDMGKSTSARGTSRRQGMETGSLGTRGECGGGRRWQREQRDGLGALNARQGSSCPCCRPREPR